MLNSEIAAFPADFSKLDLASVKRVTLAVSGGGDSTALLRMFHHHWVAELRRAPGDLLAVTVDHQVRAESAEEARAVAAWCQKLGVQHSTVIWDGASQMSGFQNAAREARYDLISRAANEFGASTVLTGHTLDDQAETIAMRAQRSDPSQAVGLAGIAPATLFQRNVWFVRPLLDQNRAKLRDWLEQNGHNWFDDPSNESLAYERVRARNTLAGSHPRAEVNSHDHAAARIERAANAAIWLRALAVSLVESSTGTIATVPADFLKAEHASEGFTLLLMCIGQRAYWPDKVAAERCISEILRGNGRSFTVSGCMVRRSEDTVTIIPEQRNTQPKGFGFDHLLPVWELAALDALDELRGLAAVVRPPVR
ncbi:MAG: tRNA lysidine(34) synthetase TilS [Pseudomonadota bacterium]